MCKRRLTCCICGADAGRWQQHWNRDHGYGVCVKCIKWLRNRNTSEKEIADLYGKEGVHWGHDGMEHFHQVTEERYYDMLGAVPPRLMTHNSFLVGEAYDTRLCSIAKLHCFTYQAFLEREGMYFEANVPMTVTEFKDMLDLGTEGAA